MATDAKKDQMTLREAAAYEKAHPKAPAGWHKVCLAGPTTPRGRRRRAKKGQA
jgi:hypothetical protein